MHREDVTCRLCGLQQETANHVVTECNRHELRLALNSEQEENTHIVTCECYSFDIAQIYRRTRCLIENLWDRNKPKWLM